MESGALLWILYLLFLVQQKEGLKDTADGFMAAVGGNRVQVEKYQSFP